MYGLRMSTTEQAAARTERVNLMITPEEKRVIEVKAEAAGLTLSELFRRGAKAYEPDLEPGEARMILRSIGEMADRLIPEIDANLARMSEQDRAFEGAEALRERALRDFAANGWAWTPAPHA